MECKPGYEGPLCAVCSEEYYEQLRGCVECKDPHTAGLAVFILGLVLFISIIVYLLRRYGHFITNEVAANFKITVSFVTTVSTISTQFGVTWPPKFLAALATMSALTFDLSVLSGVFCLFKVSFLASLCFSTGSLVLVLIVCFSISKLKPHLKDTCIKFCVYLLLFAYPVVSVKCVEAFACHNVDGESYLRADYSVNCASAEWNLIAGYASIFVAIYVVLLPVAVLGTLYRYRKQAVGRKVAPEGLLFAFLLDDYRLIMPCLMWDGLEMLRKLALSVVGAFWTSQSPMAIATALLLSLGFLSLQQCYQPFKSKVVNRVQNCFLAALSLMYFAGQDLFRQSISY